MKKIRKLTITGKGKTYYVTLPRWMVEQLKWRKGKKVEIKLRGKGIVIGDLKRE